MDHPRIEDLRRRVEKDPASIAFAQLGEEYRRAGGLREAVEVCRAGLTLHPGYLSARVTLGRALLELGDLDEALLELQLVLSSAPDNLAAIRGLAEIYHRRDELPEALTQYRLALGFARNDPDLLETISDVERKLGTSAGPRSYDGLSYEQIKSELSVQVPSVPLVLTPVRPAGAAGTAVVEHAPPRVEPQPAVAQPEVEAEQRSADHTVAALHDWLTAIHVTRAIRHP